MKKSTMLWIALLSSTIVRGQEATVSSGGESTGSGGASSYTIGQLIYTAENGSSGSISQGVQQPFEIFVLNEAENNVIPIHVSVYPNPAQAFLKLDIKAFQSEKFEYSLLDMGGKQLKNGAVISVETKIELSELASSSYFLVITNTNEVVKTFKIIKN